MAGGGQSRKAAIPQTPKGAVQDVPPSGGYGRIRISNPKPPRGPSGALIWGAAAASIVFGLWRVMRHNHFRSLEAEEAHSARVAVAPFMQAEEDARYLRAFRRSQDAEKRVMSTVPRWQPEERVFQTGPWVNERVVGLRF